jgi:hypothetical protein
MSMMSMVAVVVLRYSEHTFDAALNAADDPADCTAHDCSNRTCRMTALLGPFLCTPNDSLSLRC